MRSKWIALLFAVSLHAAPARVVSVVEPVTEIGKTLTLRVDGDTGDCKSLVLFIQRSPIHGLTARCGSGTVAFDLAVNDKNAEAWHHILGGHWFSRMVTVGLGPNDQQPFDTSVVAEPFRIIKPWRVTLITLISLALIAALVIVRMKTHLVDSIARMQIALWIVIIAASYAYIWSITGETETINGSALALVAIGAGTAAGAAMLKGAKRVDVKTVVQTMQSMPAADLTPTEMSGPTGLHALMIGTWTVVLAVVFVASVFRILEMPEFSAAVLAILGISGGTYLAFSMPQRH